MPAAAVTMAPAPVDHLPRFPKAGPPSDPLPEPPCDVSHPSDGAWLIGRWTAPGSRLAFLRRGGAIVWRMEWPPRTFGPGTTRGGGTVAERSGCTVRFGDTETDGFVFRGLLTGTGDLYGYAAPRHGHDVRFLFHRER
jgi:hypothetical protein